MVGVGATQEIVMLTFIERKEKYTYIEFGLRNFATVVEKNNK